MHPRVTPARLRFACAQARLPTWQPTFYEAQNVSEELKDCVRLATAAQREGCGNLVWLSYDLAGPLLEERIRAGEPVAPARQPSNGTTLLALSKEGAQFIRHHMATEMGVGHWDLCLKEALRRIPPNWQDRMGACDVLPPIGHYAAHQSGCDPRLGVRRTSWGSRWVQEGTRRDPSDPLSVHRKLMKFSPNDGKKSSPTELRVVQLPEEADDLIWLTYRAPRASATAAAAAVEPVAAAAAATEAAGAAAAAAAEEEQGPTLRQRRRGRTVARLYDFRNFVEDRDQAP